MKEEKIKKAQIEKNSVIITELNKIRNYLLMLELDTMPVYIIHKENIPLINKKLALIESLLKENLTQLRESINNFFLSLSKVELTLCEQEEPIFKLLKNKQECLQQLNLLMNEIKEKQ